MPSEREIKEKQHERLFDLLELKSAPNEEQRMEVLNRQIAKAEAVMTNEEIAFVREKATKKGR